MRALLALLLLASCGSDRAEETAPPEPVSAAEAPEAAPSEAEPAAAHAPEADAEGASPESWQVVGADRTHLMFLDVSAEPWSVERVEAGPVVPLHAASFVGCGARAAGRTSRAVGVWERSGELVGRATLPNLVQTLGARLTSEIERIDTDYEAGPSPESVIGVGPLVQTDAGALAMTPTFSMEPFHGEMEGCVSPLPSMQVPLPIDGVEPAPCARPTFETVSLSFAREEAPPTGFECAYFFVEGEHAEPSWLGRPLEDVVAALPFDPELCDAVPDDSWERLGECTLVGLGGNLTVCKHEGDPHVFAALVQEESMGCDAGPDLFVLQGRRVAAHTGWGAELRVLDDLWIYGGRSSWFVHGPGRAPIRFGRASPDVVRGRAR